MGFAISSRRFAIISRRVYLLSNYPATAIQCLLLLGDVRFGSQPIFSYYTLGCSRIGAEGAHQQRTVRQPAVVWSTLYADSDGGIVRRDRRDRLPKKMVAVVVETPE